MTALPSMPTEPDKNVVSLKEYIDTRFHAFEENMATHLASLEKAVAAALNSQAVAIVKAEQATDFRLASMNEFRKTVEDQSNKQATKIELDALRSELIAEMKAIRSESNAKIEADRNARDIESKAMWKVIYGLATAVAVVQAILQFTP